MASACNSLKWDFSARDWGPVLVPKANPSHLPVVNGKVLVLPLCRKQFLERWTVVKQVKYLLGRRVQSMWTDTQADSESSAFVAVYITYLEHFFWVFWVSSGQSFLFVSFRVNAWFISGSSHVYACISSPRSIPLKRPMGSCHQLVSFPFWFPRRLSVSV